MGGSFDKKGVMLICDGGDVLAELNEVFNDPESDRYKYAQSHNRFGDIPNAKGNYKLLIDAYDHARVPVGRAWAAYLTLLGSVRVQGPQQGPQNIYDIAQIRYNGLIDGVAMETTVHVPKNGGHVHAGRGSGKGPSTISSPCPLPPDRKKKPAAKKKPPAKKKAPAKKKSAAKKSAKSAVKKKSSAKKSAKRPAKKSARKRR